MPVPPTGHFMTVLIGKKSNEFYPLYVYIYMQVHLCLSYISVRLCVCVCACVCVFVHMYGVNVWFVAV